jgi:stalled ribosome rescue protein Dom34
LTPRRPYKRGYPIAVLVGFEDDRATLWKVYSHVVKPEKTVWLEETWNDQKAVYNFLEKIVNALRPTFNEGVRSIILASPPRTDHAKKFIEHVRRHHAWVVQGPSRATFSEKVGTAGTLSEVAALVKTPGFRKLIDQTTSQETEDLVNLLEKRLNSPNQSTLILYSLREAEKFILDAPRPGRPEAEYLLLTNKFLSDSREKNRLHRLMQIAANRKVKTRIVDAATPAGARLTQLGGIVCLARRQ